MADKEVKDKQDKPVNAEGARAVNTRNQQTWIIWVVIVGFVVLILLAVGAVAVAHRLGATRTLTNMPTVQFMERSNFGGYRGASFYSQSSSTDGPTTTTTTTKYTVTVGVVTKVNSDSIVVAGNGKTQTVATNSSTTYDNNAKPAVNDTVRIIGTADSSNNVTATEVQVANN